MTLQDKLLYDRSKDHIIHLAKEIGHDHSQLDELWTLLKTGEPPIPQRAAWLLDYSTAENPEWVTANMEELITQLPKPSHNSLQRSISKVLSRVDIPEAYQGELFSLCLDWLLNPTIHVAIKAHSMSVAYNIAKGVPELEEELSLVIRDQMEFNSVGFQARGKQILKKLGIR